MGYHVDVLESDEGVYEALRQHDDAVLSDGDRARFDPAATYHIPVPPAGSHSCGYVVDGRPAPATLCEGLRR